MSRVIDRTKLPADYPTQTHPSEFWEALGRAVATFGFLEDVLGRAIFAVTGSKEIAEAEVEAELKKWTDTLRKALEGTLGRLIVAYETALRDKAPQEAEKRRAMFDALREANVIRNALCHGCWQKPGEDGKCEVRYFDQKRGRLMTRVDTEFLKETQKATVSLAFDVIDSVTLLGLKFPGASADGSDAAKGDDKGQPTA